MIRQKSTPAKSGQLEKVGRHGRLMAPLPALSRAKTLAVSRPKLSRQANLLPPLESTPRAPCAECACPQDHFQARSGTQGGCFFARSEIDILRLLEFGEHTPGLDRAAFFDVRKGSAPTTPGGSSVSSRSSWSASPSACASPSSGGSASVCSQLYLSAIDDGEEEPAPSLPEAGRALELISRIVSSGCFHRLLGMLRIRDLGRFLLASRATRQLCTDQRTGKLLAGSFVFQRLHLNKIFLPTLQHFQADLVICTMLEARKLAEQIATMRNLHTLFFAMNTVFPPRLLARCLTSKPMLRVLDISQCSFGTLAGASDFLRTSLPPQLELLYCSHNEIGDELLESLCFGLRSVSRLRGLFLRHNRITTAGSEALASFLQVVGPQFSTLDLRRNKLLDTGLAAVVRSLPASASALWLSFNHAGPDCAVALAHAVCFSSLVRVSLSGAKLGDTASRALFVGLTSASQLNYLDISANELTQSSGMTLGDTLRANTTLRELDLRTNALGNEGVKWMAAGLQSNARTALRMIRLSRNGIGMSGTRALRSMLVHGFCDTLVLEIVDLSWDCKRLILRNLSVLRSV
eukprot:CAMPEP_0204317030 /NCGR_PEP_ID=MMETSP0469-20131031/5732_1 /ASSEMBLY_ACC=CAM_ASM_000384 /TAXON_ID=2969 /ORGANISM="Oxyrrhis marina" /LENGTH=575 /DNA_ID=CAMNT_0051297891 /DNA_START=25 /DNA_END=1749 /DNA_ORIENTATION=+